MKPDTQLSRPLVLMAITERAVRETRGGVIAFADRVAELYLDSVPADHRRAKIRPLVGDIDQIGAAQKANRQTIDRYIKGDVKAFPADLEEAWVKALPEPYHAEALRELAARYGLMAARLAYEQTPLATIGEVLDDVGNLAKRMAPIIADGKIDSRDRPHAKPALASISDLQAKLASMSAQLTSVLADEQEGVIPLRRAAK